LAPARTRLARKQNAGLLVGSPSFADTASRSRSQPKMEDNLFTSPKLVPAQSGICGFEIMQRAKLLQFSE
jgi:hypothetical protein